MDPVASMLAALDLTDTGARTAEDIFTGPSQWMPNGRVFGGQVLAQSVVAASRTLGPERLVHSLHSYFLRPGDVASPITFGVDRIHDGRSFSTRRVQAYQSGVPILSLIASFQTLDDGVEYQEVLSEDAPEPESLPTSAERLSGVDDARAIGWATGRAFDIRHIPDPVYITADASRAPHQAVWVRAFSRLPDDPVLHRAALAYVMDYTIFEPLVRVSGVSWATEGFRMASLDHAMWWHRPARADEWLLFVEDALSASGGRGLGLARVFNRDGVHIATAAQEGMLRMPRPEASERQRPEERT